MVENPVTAVTALQRTMQRAVRFPVKVCSELQQGVNCHGGILHENLNGFRIVLETAGNHGVLFMQFRGVVLRRLVNASDSALSEGGITEGHFLLTDEQNLAVGG